MVEVLEERRVPLPVAKRILEEVSARLDSPIVNRAYDHARLFSKCEADAAEEAMKALMELGLSDFASSMLVNIVPRDVEEAKALLADIDGGYSEEVIVEAVKLLGERCQGEAGS